jgi:hypothetical protein
MAEPPAHPGHARQTKPDRYPPAAPSAGLLEIRTGRTLGGIKMDKWFWLFQIAMYFIIILNLFAGIMCLISMPR